MIGRAMKKPVANKLAPRKPAGPRPVVGLPGGPGGKITYTRPRKQLPVGPAKPVGGGFKPKMPIVPPRVQKPVGSARPVGALRGPTGAGGMAKMPTIGGAARRPDMGRVQKPMMNKGGMVTASKVGKAVKRKTADVKGRAMKGK
jgi:hypothetical protein